MEQHIVQADRLPKNICYDNYTLTNIYDPAGEYIWMLCMVEYKIQRALLIFVPPVFIIVGSIGNVLAFVVLTRKNVRQWSVCFYLSVYVVTNTLVLYIGCGLQWVSQITNLPHIVNLADWSCRVWQFLFTVILYSTWWIMVAMSVDRFLVLWLPSRAQQWCTVFMAKVATIIIYVGIIVINIHAMWTYDYEPTLGQCYNPPGDTYPFVWALVQATLNSYVPILLIFIFIIAMTIGLIMPSVRSQLVPVQEQLTITTLLTALCFLLLVLPGITINLLEYSLTQWVTSNVRHYYKWQLARTLGQALWCFNCSVTFVIYFASMPMLRSELWHLMRRLKCNKYGHSRLELSTIEANGDIAKTDEPATATLL